MKMKRLLSWSLVVLLLFVGACGNREEPSSSASSEPPAANTGSSETNGAETGEGDAATEAVEFTFAHIFDTNHPLHVRAQEAADALERESGGRYKIRIVPGGSLGDMETNHQGLSLGTIDITIVGGAYLGRSYEPLLIGSAPYVFRDNGHVRKYFESDLFKEFIDEYESITGNVILNSVYTGARHVTSNKPIHKPEDMKGLKIRVPDAELFLAMPNAVGAKPTPIAFGEVYLALQNGTVDAQENPLVTIDNMKFYEVQKYINLTAHINEPAHTVMSPKAWEKIRPEDREMVLRIFGEAALNVMNDIDKNEEEILAKFEAAGNIVNRDVDIPAFIAAVEPFNTSPERPWTAEHYRRLQEIR